ncbi:hypothetical protein [Modestobacter altitudinis]|uniref:hypothetical protein n=1 Tax=Modestobacter altitudinis TaxID=2213158 RepID=UPI0014869305|nr:hypothetical protein [Modestobacter altitudinis]
MVEQDRVAAVLDARHLTVRVTHVGPGLTVQPFPMLAGQLGDIRSAARLLPVRGCWAR